MMSVRANISGLKGLKPRARHVAARAGEALKHVLADGAEAIAANARARVLALRDGAGPSDLADSIHVAETEAGADVVAGAPHAPYVEFGTRRMAAQPFLAAAMAEERGSIIERAGRLLGPGDEV